jgi:hypothetical protein
MRLLASSRLDIVLGHYAFWLNGPFPKWLMGYRLLAQEQYHQGKKKKVLAKNKPT